MHRRMGRQEDLLHLQSINVVYLPKRTTSNIQPVDAGVVACIKRRYRREQI